ncbi:MAG TPA: hypothetical protein VGH10_01075 [Actinomycetota bacterium]|jgi:hypothetical protein
MDPEAVCATCHEPIGESMAICFLSEGSWLVVHADCATQGSYAEAG